MYIILQGQLLPSFNIGKGDDMAVPMTHTADTYITSSKHRVWLQYSSTATELLSKHATKKPTDMNLFWPITSHMCNI